MIDSLTASLSLCPHFLFFSLQQYLLDFATSRLSQLFFCCLSQLVHEWFSVFVFWDFTKMASKLRRPPLFPYNDSSVFMTQAFPHDPAVSSPIFFFLMHLFPKLFLYLFYFFIIVLLSFITYIFLTSFTANVMQELIK